MQLKGVKSLKMNSKIWLDIFFQSLKKFEEESNIDGDAEWTALMMKVMNDMGSKMNYRVVSRHSESKLDSGEYLGIDVMFLDKTKYSPTREMGVWDPFILPSAVVEHENDYSHEKIAYDLWKIACIRTELKVLICYQAGWEQVDSLRKGLENIIISNGLMSKDNGELLVIIGDGKEGDKKWAAGTPDWRSYLNVFQWNNKLVPVLLG